MRPGPRATPAGLRIVCCISGLDTCHVAHRPTPIPAGSPPNANQTDANEGTMTNPMHTRPPSWPAISTTPAHALAFAARLDRRADLLLAEGRYERAERVSHQAFDAREQAREARP